LDPELPGQGQFYCIQCAYVFECTLFFSLRSVFICSR
jgi:hypothetical protein